MIKVTMTATYERAPQSSTAKRTLVKSIIEIEDKPEKPMSAEEMQKIINGTDVEAESLESSITITVDGRVYTVSATDFARAVRPFLSMPCSGEVDI